MSWELTIGFLEKCSFNCADHPRLPKIVGFPKSKVVDPPRKTTGPARLYTLYLYFTIGYPYLAKLYIQDCPRMILFCATPRSIGQRERAVPFCHPTPQHLTVLLLMVKLTSPHASTRCVPVEGTVKTTMILRRHAAAERSERHTRGLPAGVPATTDMELHGDCDLSTQNCLARANPTGRNCDKAWITQLPNAITRARHGDATESKAAC